MKEMIISTNAFDGFRTSIGYFIEEKRAAYKRTGWLMVVISAVCIPFSFLIAEVPIKKMIIFVLTNGLWYGGIVLGIAGIVYLIRSLKVFKPKTIVFDTLYKEVQIGKRKIPFNKIENLQCKVFELFGKKIVKIQFKENGLPTPLITSQIVHDTSVLEIQNFVAELKNSLAQ